ncbi:MAG: hypothetical protein EOP50_03110, partial [Sphingobacteriales bacterium]
MFSDKGPISIWASLRAGLRLRLVGLRRPLSFATICMLFSAPSFAQCTLLDSDPQNQAGCSGSAVSFSAAILNGAGPVTYQWQVSNGGSFADISGAAGSSNSNISLNLSNIGSGANSNGAQYLLIVTDANGCSDTSQPATLTINSDPNVSASSSGNICSGGSATLTANGAGTYSWSPSTGLSATSGSSVTA